MKYLISIFILFLSFHVLYSQEDNIHEQSSGYEWPEDPLVLDKLEQWRDLKFGMIIHWGLYAQAGIVESWELTSEDWINRKDSMTHHEYKQWYRSLKDDFNPVNFNPDAWAETAKRAGMKYVVFTTKHHDGFNMFDTQFSDFKITNGPFADDPKADVVQYVFDAFRKQDMMIGAYFSKPDWSSQYFWWEKYATDDRNVNYNLSVHPDRWQKYQQFVFNQVEELTTGYGDLDILWFDGGWVREGRMVHGGEQSVNMPALADMARTNQPGILIVDRTVPGKYENYQTPERTIPEEQLTHPWESCIPLNNNWGYVPKDESKSSEQIIHSLVEIVAKGGSLLLGIGPKPDGTIRESDVVKMNEIGDWLQVNGEAIYGTRTLDAYQSGNVFFTRKESKVFAIHLFTENGASQGKLEWMGNLPKRKAKMRLLETGEEVSYTVKGNQVLVNLPRGFVPSVACVLTYEIQD
ncbi:MAG: alpha-L-fucosidase [Flammeovirgaceae bacterium]|nr:alpha-L-fucosidase [Flammeovirgaceae bacterium]MBE63161.1 alpha-L-fucosidase [Flammeovirgaceae bacterium]HCX23308.1 alpha-L-fucosidase [Cytophagales bacterium]|tara:strand:+ start:815 stop:2203 length:1389 start_codon:yes stop_codon:yes gene_type:complete